MSEQEDAAVLDLGLGSERCAPLARSPAKGHGFGGDVNATLLRGSRLARSLLAPKRRLPDSEDVVHELDSLMRAS